MTCSTCEVLRAQVADLQRELGVRRRAGEIGAVMEALGVGATQARLLLRLYAAGGKAVPQELLRAELSGCTPENVRQHVYTLRQKLGDDAISSFREAGYALSTPLVSRILAAVEPVTLAREVVLDGQS